MKLYEITSEYLQTLNSLQVDEETGEVLSIDALGLESRDKFEEKAVSVAKYFLGLDAEIKAIRDAEIKMQERRHTLQKKSDGLKKYLKYNMEKSDILNFKCDYFEVKLGKNPGQIIIYDESKVSREYKLTELVTKIDKIAIKNAIKAGKEVNGASIQIDSRLIIK